jgi:hypothetical protein
MGIFAYPPKKFISGFEFAIPLEVRTPLLKSRGFLCCAPSKSELNTEIWTEGDLAGTPVSFSLSVRNMCCSQVEQDVLRQDAAVLRYAPRVIRTKRAQQSAPFSGRTLDVRAPLHL